MADVYVRSGAGGSGTGADWANAYTTLNAAYSAKAAGDDFWVSEDHSQTQGSFLTLPCPGTSSSPCRTICVDHAGSVPPVPADFRTTAVIATTSSSTLSATGTGYFYGLNLQRNTSAAGQQITIATNSGDCQVWENSSMVLNSTGNSARITLGTGSSGQKVTFINTTVGFGVTAQQLQVHCAFEWLNTSSAVSGTIPTTLIQPGSSGGACSIILRGVDLSGVGSGKNLVDMSTSAPGRIRLIDCKTDASVTLTTGSVASPGSNSVEIVNYGSGSTNYKYYYQDFSGAINQETTIVRSGGASNGTTAFSRKMVTSSSSRIYFPLVLGPMAVWNESTSSVTVTVHVVTDNVTLTDADCWIEVEELGTSGYPLSVCQSDRVTTILSTPANQTTSTETWTTTGLSTPVKQKLSVTFTPALKGPFRIRVMLAKSSTTVYVCPKVEIT